MNEPAAKSKVPVDRLDVRANFQFCETGLFADFAERGGVGLFALFKMPLGKSPVLVAVADQQIQRLGGVALLAKHDAPRRRLAARLVAA
jgi:hypothetical protein